MTGLAGCLWRERYGPTLRLLLPVWFHPRRVLRPPPRDRCSRGAPRPRPHSPETPQERPGAQRERQGGIGERGGMATSPRLGLWRPQSSDIKKQFLTPGLGTLTLRRRRQLPRNRVPHPSSKGCSSASGALVMCKTPQKHLVRKCSLFERREARRPTRAGRRAKLPVSEHCSNSSSFNEVQRRHV